MRPRDARHGIIGSHNGTITAESKVGTGTRFTIRLPIHRNAAQPLPEED